MKVKSRKPLKLNIGGSEMKTVTVDGVKYVAESDVKKVKAVIPIGDKSNPFMEVGKNYFIRTVTHYFTGTLEWVGEKEIALKSACWIADTGRFSDFMQKGTWNESEPYNPEKVVIVGRGSIIDMTERDLIIMVK
jgi:hypothetical protein